MRLSYSLHHTIDAGTVSIAGVLLVEAAVDTGSVSRLTDVLAVHGEDGHADKEVKGELQVYEGSSRSRFPTY